jgi:hypothetical protein
MDVANFYRSIFPATGYRALAVFKNGLKSAPTQNFYDTDEDFIEAAETYDKLGKNVYHGCATYTTANNRTAENVAAVKALWIDADVGENKPYATQKEAASDIEKFRLTVGLAAPYLVSSGRGIHAYFPFTGPISGDAWVRLAGTFRACLDHFGVKHDSSRTEDRASILRIPGTHNYKANPASSVRILREGVEAPAASILKALKVYSESNSVFVLPKIIGKTQVTNELVGNVEYPPSEGPRIAAGCAVIGSVESTGGDVSYDIWWRSMGIAKHVVDPEIAAAHWTRNREATGHEKSEWQPLVDAWSAGPTTCSEFAKHSPMCATCPHNGTIKSPIQLGVSPIPIVTPLTVVPVSAKKKAPGPWGFLTKWVTDEIRSNLGVGRSATGKMTMVVKDEHGNHNHLAFCDRWWQVMQRVRGADGIWYLEIAYEMYGNTTHRTFLMEAAAVTSTDLLRKAFSARELHIYGGTRAMQKAQEVLVWETNNLYGYELDTPTYKTMGWATHNGAPTGEINGEFVIGDTLLRPKQPPQQILLADTVPTNFSTGFRTKGTTAEWVSLVDRIYNRPGAEPYQFVFCAMFAAPLVKLVPGEGDWHGIPIALGGDSGAAKTSTALAAMTLYGPPAMLRFNANSSKDGQGDTVNALAIKVGTLSHIPFIADEMTGVDSEKISSIMLMLSAGQLKDRASPNGQLVQNPFRWDTLSIVTGNESLHEKLKMLRNQNTKDASKLRVFEVTFRESDLKRIFPDVNKTIIEHDLMGEQFGCAGRDWLQFVVNNRTKISEKLGKRRATYQIENDDRSAIRFYKDLLVTIEVGAQLAKAKGLIHFDIDAMMRWARVQLGKLRDSVFERDWDGTISDFVASLHGRTIVTKHFALGRGRRPKSAAEHPMETLSSAVIPVARRAIEDRILVVTANALNKWADENGVQPSTLVNAMADGGYLLSGTGTLTPRLINIGSGTSVTRPQAPCWQLNYERIVGSIAEGSDPADNVVPLKNASATEMVTNEGGASVDTALKF